MSATNHPQLPVPLADLAGYIAKHPDEPVAELFKPYREYEAQLRQMYAQEPDHELLKDPYANVVPLFTEDTPELKIRARNLETESEAEKAKYIMPLPADVRRPDGSRATVGSLKEFQRNFNVFSESSLVDLDWSNVVAAGSSAVNCLVPVPEEFNASKRSLREFYHEKFCPASDVDLFLYGLTEEEAVEKIKQIEAKVRDSLLTETTTVRTKHAVTICSQYPTRHIQIVLRIYKSVSEILTGFDIDCSGAAYDGKQVYCTPRALQSYITQINHIDLSRRSPSYENRLSKYGHRGFEVYWGDLERSRIDPTIFERSFQRTVGLARLLVLERLPTASSRDDYLSKRREERGRPALNPYSRNLHSLAGNIKEQHEDEVAEWIVDDELTASNYNTFTVPYGPKYHAKRIEKLCYTRDLLLNAEWNQPEDRKVYLHRHPAFFGRVADVVNDCCGYCPKPETDEEREVAEQEDKIYVSGRISFLRDNPGRQQIGSFNPLTDSDWTEMAYVGNTARLCQAIVDGDAEAVQDWLAQEGADPNTRDYTGRTPLHLAVISSTPEIVRHLVDAGARLVARLADGRTALHLAAERGDTEIVKILMDKSNANEAEEEEKTDRRRKMKAAGPEEDGEPAEPVETDSSDESSDGELIDDDESDDAAHSIVTGSFVKLKKGEDSSNAEDAVPEDTEDDPDFYDINAIAWDRPCSALHLAIISGHEEVVKLLCQEYGADVLLPVKLLDHRRQPSAALLTLVLALALPVEQAKSMAKTLLSLGATSAQGDLSGITAFHRYVQENAESLLDVLRENDQTGAKAAINSIAFTTYHNKAETPLQAAAENGNLSMVLKLLDSGAVAEIDFETWLKSAKQVMESQLGSYENNQNLHKTTTQQPLILALQSSADPSIALELIERGADVNSMTTAAHQKIQRSWYSYSKGESALDLVRSKLEALRKYEGEGKWKHKPELPRGIDECLQTYKAGTYQHWMVSENIASIRRKHAEDLKEYEKEKSQLASSIGVQEKRKAIQELTSALERVEEVLLEKGAKTFKELHPDVRDDSYNRNSGAEEPSVEDYKFSFGFGSVTDLTVVRTAAYIELFEAVWNGDLEAIKNLTLTSWDGLGLEAPLKIAVTDNLRNNPFSLALFRGHHQVARAVLEIAQAQYAPEEKSKARYRMETGDDNECCSECDSESESDDDDSRPKIYRELVDQRFTIENVGQVSMKVNSRTKPLELLGWSCQEYHNGELGDMLSAFKVALKHNDLKMLKFLLDLADHFTTQKLDISDEMTGSSFYSFPAAEFNYAVDQGRTEMLAEIIRRTGAGLPLEELVKNSGLELVEKPRHYQGLTVYGKKRSDWAAEGRQLVSKPVGTETSPLITAALAGRIESVEWFLSDAPTRHYLDFSRSKAARDDARLKHLSQSPGGFDGAISSWLNNQKDLVIHAAILGPPGDKTDALVAYLVKTFPDFLEAKSKTGVTPLFLAAHLGRTSIARILVAAGADQTCKNSDWENLLHAALARSPPARDLGALLDVLDAGLVRRMCGERSSLAHSGKTPLHQFLHDVVGAMNKTPSRRQPYKSTRSVVGVVDLLVRRSGGGGRELATLDGAGDTPLHGLIARGADARLVRAVLDSAAANAEDGDSAAVTTLLLHRENAVGRTPLEVARDRFVGAAVAPREPRRQPEDAVERAVGRPPRSFALDAVDDASDADSDTDDDDDDDNWRTGYNPNHAHQERVRSRAAAARTWELCVEYAGRGGGATATAAAAAGAHHHQHRRRLVGLHEANDVARRLGERHSGARYAFKVRRGGEGEGEREREVGKEDVVQKYWHCLPYGEWRKGGDGK